MVIMSIVSITLSYIGLRLILHNKIGVSGMRLKLPTQLCTKNYHPRNHRLTNLFMLSLTCKDTLHPQ
ncbi:hypothetical protein ALTER154_80090 [Alteromonas sp. 154]|nr:hypothetical protein ALTER154_80090 [Alteromonas sp. 154]